MCVSIIGSWSQVLASKLFSQKSDENSNSRIVAVDLQEMAPIDGVYSIVGMLY